MHLPTMLHAKNTSSDLVPVTPPVAVYAEHVAPAVTTLVLKEKAWSMSGDDFSITDAATGKTAFKCSGKYMSMHDRKKIYDNTGKLLYNMADKLFAMHKTMVCEGSHGKEILKVKKKWSKGSALKATFVDAEDKEHVIELHGDMFGTTAQIRLATTGANLAYISRKLVSAADAVADKQTYNVTIAPGVDASLIAAVCICFDEVENEDHH